MLELVKALVQGIIQGITEWLPISSTGHILLLDAVWPFTLSKDFFDLFKVVIQLGSILAVVVLYFRTLNPLAPSKSSLEKKKTWSLWGKIAVASIPTGIAGVLFEDIIDSKLSVPWVIATTLIVYGVLFLVMESSSRKARFETVEQISYKTAFLIGLFEALALIPGTSRSGATILGAVLLGASRTVSAEFSFFMAIPAMAGASGFKLLKLVLSGTALSTTEWLAILVGTVVSFVVSMVVIRFLMQYIRRHDFKAFGYYRIVLGIAVLVCFFAGVLAV